MCASKNKPIELCIQKRLVSLPAEGSRAARTMGKALRWARKRLRSKRSSGVKDVKDDNVVQFEEGPAHSPAEHVNCEINRHFKIYLNSTRLEYFFIDRDSHGWIIPQRQNNRMFQVHVDEDDPEFRNFKAIACRPPAKRRRHYMVIADPDPEFDLELTSKQTHQILWESYRLKSCKPEEDQSSDDAS